MPTVVTEKSDMVEVGAEAAEAAEAAEEPEQPAREPGQPEKLARSSPNGGCFRWVGKGARV